MQGFLTEVNGEVYIFPLEDIDSSSLFQQNEITRVVGKGECISRSGQLLSVLSLSKAMGHFSHQSKNEKYIVVLKNQDKRFAISLDNILGIKQCVLKPMEGLQREEYIKGAAIMGNSAVAMVLDSEKLFSRFISQNSSGKSIAAEELVAQRG
jgi:two-component system chemotaxis sensor kinase CheA